MRTIRAAPATDNKKKMDTKKMEIRMSHCNQMVACTALPTLGRNQSMFDTKNASDMDDLELSMTEFVGLDHHLDLLRDDDEEEEEYDAYRDHMNLTWATTSTSNPPSTFAMLSNLSETSQLSTTSARSSGTSTSSGEMLMDDSSSRSQGSTSSTRSSGSGIQDFLQARISTFQKNMDTIAEIVADQFEENTSASK